MFSSSKPDHVLIPLKKDMLVELLRREKEGGIKPDPDTDIFLKVCYICHRLHLAFHGHTQVNDVINVIFSTGNSY